MLKSEIEDIIDSLAVTMEKQQRILLDNLPSTEDDRKRVD